MWSTICWRTTDSMRSVANAGRTKRAAPRSVAVTNAAKLFCVCRFIYFFLFSRPIFVFIFCSSVLFLLFSFSVHRGTAGNPARHNAESGFAALNRHLGLHRGLE